MNAQRNLGYQIEKKDAMTAEEFESWYNSNLYEKECDSCGKTHSVQTQEDASPEYYTEIDILCDCGTKVGFSLPVN